MPYMIGIYKRYQFGMVSTRALASSAQAAAAVIVVHCQSVQCGGTHRDTLSGCGDRHTVLYCWQEVSWQQECRPFPFSFLRLVYGMDLLSGTPFHIIRFFFFFFLRAIRFKSNSQLTVSTIVCEEGDRRVVVSLIDNLVCLSLMLACQWVARLLGGVPRRPTGQPPQALTTQLY